MKSEISRISHVPGKRYSGLYQQQGRMLTDADWNELVEILQGRFGASQADAVGGGAPRSGGAAIVLDNTMPKIRAGALYAEGVAAELVGPPSMPEFGFDEQVDFPQAPALPGGDCLIYADLWERHVDALEDGELIDSGLHGADTCTRSRTMAQVKWAPANTKIHGSNGIPKKGDALLSLKLRETQSEKDICDPCAEVVAISQRVGNYLFRVEVHEVKGSAGNPTSLTLKWSSENGAEQYPLDNIPPDFLSDDWVYEIVNDVSECHLGVHLATGFSPDRRVIVEHAGYPAAVENYRNSIDDPSNSLHSRVRRWDGYAVLTKKAGGVWALKAGRDKKISLSANENSDAGRLLLSLNALILDLDISDKIFVAGDYWLAAVRENDIAVYLKQQEQTGFYLLGDGTTGVEPIGIEHWYLKLAEINGGKLVAFEAGKALAFPRLTELTRLYYVSGDGQETMPGKSLPASLQVRVANGQWPVEGAGVRFTVVSGGGALSVSDLLTGPDGVASSAWTLGTSGLQQAKAELLDATGDPVADSALIFNAGLSVASDVAYTLPTCSGNTVKALLGSSLNALVDGKPDLTVNDILQALLCLLNSGHVPHLPTGTEVANNVGDALHDKVDKHGDSMSGPLTINNGLTVSENVSIGGDITIAGDLTVNGDTTTVNVGDMQVEDNIIRVNKYPNRANPLIKNGGLEVFRGGNASFPNAQLIWDETHDIWKIGVENHLWNVAYGPVWEALINNSVANDKHRHSKLVAPDGNPDPALSVDNAGNVGIGTTSPVSKLDIAGGAWDPGSSEGDVRVGDATHRLKIGVATGGGGAGDVRLRAHGGTNRLILGGGTSDTLVVQNSNVGIGTDLTQPIGERLEVKGNLKLSGSILQDGWVDVGTLSNSWVRYVTIIGHVRNLSTGVVVPRFGTPYSPVSYFRDKNGIVHLRGVIASGSPGASSVIFQLPTGFRPAFNEIHGVWTDTGVGRCDIQSSGNVVAYAGGNVMFSLDGISFRAA